MREILHPERVLLGNRFIEPILMTDVLKIGLGDPSIPDNHFRWIARNEMDEEENHRRDE